MYCKEEFETFKHYYVNIKTIQRIRSKAIVVTKGFFTDPYILYVFPI